MVHWDPKSGTVLTATAAHLRIIDGGQTNDLPLSHEALLRGSLPYVPKTDDVTFRLEVTVPAGPPVEEEALFLGQAASAEPAPDTSAEGSEPAKETPPRQSPEATHPVKGTGEAGTESSEPEARLPAKPPAQIESSAPPQVKPQDSGSRPAAIAQAKPPAPVTAPPAAEPQPAAPAPALQQSIPTLAQSAPRTRNSDVAAPAAAARRGKIVWTGLLAAGQELTITGNGPSSGSMTARLPDGPISVSVYPAEFVPGGISLYTSEADVSPAEVPSPQNNWNRLIYRYAPDRAKTLQVLETPGAANNWQRLRVRSSGGSITALVISWEAR